jgi:glycosyltransferase involved in cell wall biosynthesis
MRIVQIIPGTGGTFYCQNCLRDLALVRTLRQQGHDVVVVPLYLPIDLHDASPQSKPDFYSAVSLYLRHTRPGLARWLPAAVWRWLEGMPVLRYAARRAGSTSAIGMGDITLSMLQGEQGQQAEELERLVSWLCEDVKPELIVLSNALLLGLARRIKEELRVPVVCWLQDEHRWVDALPPEESSRVWQVLCARAADVDGFVAVSRTYAQRMSAAMALVPSRIRTIHLGVDPAAFAPADLSRRPRVIGFVSRLAESEGFTLAVDAFRELSRNRRFADVRLRATGGVTNPEYVARQMQRLQAAGLADRVEILPEAFRDDRPRFLTSLSLLSTPVPDGEAFGTYVIEAMATGLPVVEPNEGAYPEIFQEAGCGVLCPESNAKALAATWATVLSDPARMADEGRRGREAVVNHFNLDRMARETVAYYQEIHGKQARRRESMVWTPGQH